MACVPSKVFANCTFCCKRADHQVICAQYRTLLHIYAILHSYAYIFVCSVRNRCGICTVHYEFSEGPISGKTYDRDEYCGWSWWHQNHNQIHTVSNNRGFQVNRMGTGNLQKGYNTYQVCAVVVSNNPNSDVRYRRLAENPTLRLCWGSDIRCKKMKLTCAKVFFSADWQLCTHSTTKVGSTATRTRRARFAGKMLRDVGGSCRWIVCMDYCPIWLRWICRHRLQSTKLQDLNQKPGCLNNCLHSCTEKGRLGNENRQMIDTASLSLTSGVDLVLWLLSQCYVHKNQEILEQDTAKNYEAMFLTVRRALHQSVLGESNMRSGNCLWVDHGQILRYRQYFNQKVATSLTMNMNCYNRLVKAECGAKITRKSEDGKSNIHSLEHAPAQHTYLQAPLILIDMAVERPNLYALQTYNEYMS